MKKMRHHLCALKTIARTVVFLLLGSVGFAAVSSLNGQAAAYTYTKIAAVGETASGGFQYIFDLEPGQVNNRGDVIYVADLSPDGANDIGEGVFLLSHRQIIALSLPGNLAPGGGTFDGVGYTPAGVNDGGDAAAAIQLEPFTLTSLGLKAGLYRYSAARRSLEAAVVPFVTVAPGTLGTFQGVLFGTSINNRGEICFAGLINTDMGVGRGVFVSDKAETIRKVVIPGDPAPGEPPSNPFDLAQVAWINNRGDVGFGAHVEGQELITGSTGPKKTMFI
jgi:hypothetical protein